MGAISSLSTGFGALRRNPVLFIAALILALLGSFSYVGQIAGPVGALVLSGISILVSIFVTPFITAGFVGMAEESITGNTRLRTFFHEGKTNYISMLGAYLLFLAIFIAIAIVFFILIVVIVLAGAAAFASTGGGASGALTGVGLGLAFLGLFVLFFLVILLIAYFLQFYDAAIVVSNEGAVGGLQRSYSFVRHNLLSTIGFMIVYIIITIVAMLPILWMSFQSVLSGTTSSSMTVTELFPIILATIVLTTITTAFLYAYKVAFYVEQSEPLPAT